MLRLTRALVLVALVAAPALAWESEEDGRREEERETRLEADAFDSRLPAPLLDVRETLASTRLRARWRPLPAEVEEFELVLSLDGGRTWSLRVSPELHADRSETTWEVPNLAAADARLRIRARIDERERWGPEGASFRILSDPRRPRERWLFWESPRWDQVAGEHAPAAGFTTSGGATLHACRTSFAALPPVRTLAAPVTLATRENRSSPAPRPRASARRLTPFSERVAPLRN